MIAAYFLYFARLTSDIHHDYGYRMFDMGIYDQGIWLLANGKAPFVTLIGRNLFGDHAQFLLLGVVPLYRLRPDASTLLILQAAALALGAVPVYMLAIRRLANPLFATVLAGAYLLHPALGLTNLENFHPEAFVVPLLGFAIFAAVEDRPRMFIAFCVLALLGKEDVVLVVLPLAIWYAIRHNRKVGLAVAIGSIGAAFLATVGVMRSLSGVSTRNAWRIPFSDCRDCGVAHHGFEFVKEFFTNPRGVWNYVMADDAPNGRPFYVWQMVAPTGLVFLLAPEIALTAVIVLLANVFSTVAYQHQIAYHYSMVLLPALWMGTVYAIAKLGSERRRAIAVTIVGVAAVLGAFLWGPLPFARTPAPHPGYSPAAVAAFNEVIDRLPAEASVAAYDGFVLHVAHRERVYLWPTPFAAAHWKLFEEEGERLPEADTVEYVLLPVQLDDSAEVLEQIKGEFTEIARAENDQREGAVLYQRK